MQNSLKHNKPKQLKLPLTTLDYIMMRARYTAPKPIWGGQRVTCSELTELPHTSQAVACPSVHTQQYKKKQILSQELEEISSQQQNNEHQSHKLS